MGMWKLLSFIFDIITSEFSGLFLIFYSIELFGKPEFISLDMAIQTIMIVVGVSIVSFRSNND